MPNAVAFLVLATWPLVMVGLFRFLPPGRAYIWSVLAGYLLLPPFPTAFDFPLMPPLSKDTLPNLMAIALVYTMTKVQKPLLPESKLGKGLVFAFIFCPIFTVFTNPEPLIFPQLGIRGLYAMDVVALVILQAIMLSSYLLARQLLTTRQDMRDLLLALVIGGLAYSFPMLLEIRLSPQLNIWIYGYFQHSFEQVIRGGGFRSLVFLSHGIWAAMLIMMSVTAAIILWRNEQGSRRLKYLVATVFLAVVLVLNKTLSPVVYTTVIVAVVVLSSWRMQLRAALILAVLAFSYPVAKGLDLVPEEQILSAAAAVNDEREGSLRFRFDNENILFDRAMEKPLFGWGSWGRNHIRDAVSGRILSTADGRWIITLGVFGWIGYFAEFGLLILPIVLLAYETGQADRNGRINLSRRKSVSIPLRQTEERAEVDTYQPSPMAAGMCLILAVNVVDLLPNATLTPLTWMLAGALLGYAERVRARNAEEAAKARVSRGGVLSNPI